MFYLVFAISLSVTFTSTIVSGVVFDGRRLDDSEMSSQLLVDVTTNPDTDTKLLKHVKCRGPHLSVCPSFASDCSRAVLDNQFEEKDIAALHAIAAKGMGARPKIGGPTILDINTGFLRDSAGLVNLFSAEEASKTEGGEGGGRGLLTAEDFEVYGRVVRRLKDLVARVFQYEGLHFTAPTFITRLDGDTDWSPAEIHDEYWHRHADYNNTDHYHFSGLLYMSEYQKDFEGGRLLFYDKDTDDDSSPSEVVEPRPGRVAVFSSGPENAHRVERVTKGERFVLAFWFTCDASRQFEIFLDGQAHLEFSGRIQAQLQRQARAQAQAETVVQREGEL